MCLRWFTSLGLCRIFRYSVVTIGIAAQLQNRIDELKDERQDLEVKAEATVTNPHGDIVETYLAANDLVYSLVLPQQSVVDELELKLSLFQREVSEEMEQLKKKHEVCDLPTTTCNGKLTRRHLTLQEEAEPLLQELATLEKKLADLKDEGKDNDGTDEENENDA